MAEVTTKKSTKKAAPKKAAPQKAPEAKQAASSLTEQDYAMIAKIAAEAAAEAVKSLATPVRHEPGGKKIRAEIPDVWPSDPAEVAQMTDEQVAEFNRRAAQKMELLKAAQADKRRKYDDLSANERKSKLGTKRDPSIIRRATPPGWNGDEDDLVRVIARRHIGLGDGMSDIDELLDMPREAARRLQSSGAVEVEI